MEKFGLTDLAWVAGMVVAVLAARWAWEAYCERTADAARAGRRARSVESRDSVPAPRNIVGERLSYAMEQSRNTPGTGSGNTVPAAVPAGNSLTEQIADLDPDALLRVLAAVPGDGEDGYRWSASAIGKLVGGRLEGRIAEVRKARGQDPPPPPPADPVRTLRIDGKYEIPWEPS